MAATLFGQAFGRVLTIGGAFAEIYFIETYFLALVAVNHLRYCIFERYLSSGGGIDRPDLEGWKSLIASDSLPTFGFGGILI